MACCRREKNWGFWEEDGKLLILYGILPCTVVLEFDPLRPSEPSIRSRTCYVLDTVPILQASGKTHAILKTCYHRTPRPLA